MNWQKISLFFGILIIALVVGGLIGKYIGNLRFHSHVSAHQNPVLKTVDNMQQSRLSITDLLRNYEYVFTDYKDKPNKENKEKILDISQKLHNALSQVGSIYGLKPMRITKLFEVWQHENEQRLLTGKKLDDWRLEYLTYSVLIRDALNNAVDEFKLETYINATNRIGTNQLSDKEFQAYQKIFDKEVGPLLPKAKKRLMELSDSETRGKKYCLKIFIDGADAGSSHMAEANLFSLFVYQGEYCPFLVDNKIKEICEQSKYMFGIRDDMKEEFNRQLALCKAVSNKRKQIEKQAEQKYGEYTYNEYYTKYVQPLIPKYEKVLKEAAVKKNLYGCDMKYLPVTSYRDPNTDAKIAAFEGVGYKVCHDFFKRKDDKYSALQLIRYKGIK